MTGSHTLTQADLLILTPGELLVRCLRDGYGVQPDHTAIAEANQRMRGWSTSAGAYRGGKPDASQRACLEGDVHA